MATTTNKTKGVYVLKNQMGQVVRTFEWDHSHMVVVVRGDNQRLETLESLEVLQSNGIAFKLLAETTPTEIKKRPLKLLNGGILEFTESLGEVAPSYEAKNDRNGDFKSILRWTAAAHILLLILSFFLSQFFPLTEAMETVVVKVQPQQQEKFVPQPKVKEFKPEPKVIQTRKKVLVAVAPKKVEPTRKLRDIRTAAIKPTVDKKPVVGSKVPVKQVVKRVPTPSIDQMGALGILGGPNAKSNKAGGFDASKISNTRPGGNGGLIAGIGGGKGVAGAGLIASAQGSGGRAERVAGYGTRGRSGGVEGYGTTSMVGTGGSGFYASDIEAVEEDADVTGGLDMSQVLAVIKRHMGEIRFCYEQGLQVQPNLSGRVAIRWIINGSGRVSVANVAHTSLRHARAEGCMVGKLKNWQFPKPQGGVDVKITFPFTLKRTGQG